MLDFSTGRKLRECRVLIIFSEETERRLRHDHSCPELTLILSDESLLELLELFSFVFHDKWMFIFLFWLLNPKRI